MIQLLLYVSFTSFQGENWEPFSFVSVLTKCQILFHQFLFRLIWEHSLCLWTCVFLNSTSFICSFTAKLYHFYFLCLGDLKLWNNLSKLKSSSCLKAMFHFFKIYQYKCTFFSHKVLYFIFITKALNILKFIYHNNNTTFNSMLLVLK